MSACLAAVGQKQSFHIRKSGQQMSNLQSILAESKRDLSPWEDIPRSRWQLIADQCFTAEIPEIHSRIQALRVELSHSEN